jgi:hypothetical protein
MADETINGSSTMIPMSGGKGSPTPDGDDGGPDTAPVRTQLSTKPEGDDGGPESALAPEDSTKPEGDDGGPER